MKKIKKIAVIGAGVMGRGIALTAARAGFETVLYDIHEKSLDDSQKYVSRFLSRSVEKGKLSSGEKTKVLKRIKYTAEFSQIKGEVVIEAILENLELKQDIFTKVEAQTEGDTILASNTSTIPITRIAAKLARPQQVVGMHFFNPAPIMKLVEVISGAATDEAVAMKIFDLAKTMGKQPVMAKDEPGFIVNRVARHFYLESLKTVEENGADVEQIDQLMRSTGFRMGPFELMDLIGIETNHEVTKSLYNSFFQEQKFRPSRLQQKKVDAGHWGRKSGKGFYDYSE